jgi:hypothetical protein
MSFPDGPFHPIRDIFREPIGQANQGMVDAGQGVPGGLGTKNGDDGLQQFSCSYQADSFSVGPRVTADCLEGPPEEIVQGGQGRTLPVGGFKGSLCHQLKGGLIGLVVAGSGRGVAAP